MSNETDKLLEVQDLSVGFMDKDGQVVAITDSVHFDIRAGEFFGLAGESGCGKSVTALSLLGLLPSPGGRLIRGDIHLSQQNITSLAKDELYAIRGKEISMIFQEPAAAFNPLLTVEKQLMEIFQYHAYSGNPEKRIRELLETVGFPEPRRILRSYPHELSGGMLQRVGIVLALILKPKLIIADEPTTALDVTVQAQILELLLELQKEEGTAVLFITHNLNLIAQYADRMAVMYAGRIVETANVDDFFNRPAHPYSQGLLKALPNLESHHNELFPIPGQVPQPKDFVDGCRFKDRCDRAMDICSDKPSDYQIENGHHVGCFLYSEEVIEHE